MIFPCESPSFDVYDISDPLKISGVWSLYSEPRSRFHSYFIIVVLKRISFRLSIFLRFCLSQDDLVLNVT